MRRPVPTISSLLAVLLTLGLTIATGEVHAQSDRPFPQPPMPLAACAECYDGAGGVGCGMEPGCGVEPTCGAAVPCPSHGGGCPVGSCLRACGTPADICPAFCYDDPCDKFGCDNYCRSSCDMPQHMRYPNEFPSYYYFQPYNYQLLPLHQEFVASFGGDVRNPYDTSFLDDLSIDTIGRQEELPPAVPGDRRPGRSNPFADDPRPPAPADAEPLEPGETLEFVP